MLQFYPSLKKTSRILVAGSHAINNLGYQCGGWTATWQGVDGNNYSAGIIKMLLLFSSISITYDSLEFKYNSSSIDGACPIAQ